MTGSTTLHHVVSKDGTRIAYEALGSGPAVILVCGGSTDRGSNAGVAERLESDFTVYNYDRRGRGDSEDTLPYAVDREIEDIDAVVAAAGGSAYLYGTSSGAALALEAARALDGAITKLAMWEPPYFVDLTQAPPADQIRRYDAMLAEGRRDDMVEYFMSQVVRLPPEFVAYARTQPFWAGQEKIAHTLAYDATVMGDYAVPYEVAARVAAPTIVLVGSATFPFLLETAQVLSKALPNGQTRTLPDQQHNVDPGVMANALKDFFES
jgi:pimeloyl-ACP methyl ester carboxylesterase